MKEEEEKKNVCALPYSPLWQLHVNECASLRTLFIFFFSQTSAVFATTHAGRSAVLRLHTKVAFEDPIAEKEGGWDINSERSRRNLEVLVRKTPFSSSKHGEAATIYPLIFSHFSLTFFLILSGSNAAKQEDQQTRPWELKKKRTQLSQTRVIVFSHTQTHNVHFVEKQSSIFSYPILRFSFIITANPLLSFFLFSAHIFIYFTYTRTRTYARVEIKSFTVLVGPIDSLQSLKQFFSVRH